MSEPIVHAYVSASRLYSICGHFGILDSLSWNSDKVTCDTCKNKLKECFR